MEVTRASIDADSTAVLAFDDGTRIPCDRFILRLFCDVVRSVLEASACDVDDRHRTVIPIPRMASEPFWDAVDVLHGLRHSSALASVDQVVAVMECMMYLGSSVHEKPLETQLWTLIQNSDDLGCVVRHAPRLLRNESLAQQVVAKLIRMRPMWMDFHIDVLGSIRTHADPKIVTAIVAHACNFFPPNMVTHWGLHALELMAPFGLLSLEDAMKVVSMHGTMYHPCETVGILKKMASVGDDMLWDPSLPPMLRNVASSLEKFDMLPENPSKIHGTQIKFHDYPHTSMCLNIPTKLPPQVRLTPWLKVVFCQDGRYDIHFKPRKIDDVSRHAKAVQVRIMCFDRLDAPRGSCAEVWYFYDVDPAHDDNEAYSFAHATRCMGIAAGPCTMLRAKTARLMRIDFFYGDRNILDNPVDCNCALFSKDMP